MNNNFKTGSSEMVFPIENYTDKVHYGIRMMFLTYPHLSFTIPQMKQHLSRGFELLKECNEHQNELLGKLVATGIKKQIQLGLAKKVTSNVSVESQWQATSGVSVSGMVNITSEDSVAKTDKARHAARRRALGGMTLHLLNNERIMHGVAA